MDLSKSIKMAKAIEGKKNNDIAEAIGVKPQQVSTWCTQGRMSHKNLEAVAGFFNMSVSEFVKLGE